MLKVTMHQPSNGGGYTLSTRTLSSGAATQVMDYARNAATISPRTAKDVVAKAEAEGTATLRLVPVGRNPIHTPAEECRTITVEVIADDRAELIAELNDINPWGRGQHELLSLDQLGEVIARHDVSPHTEAMARGAAVAA